MNKPNNDSNYSFHDIERYLQGKLSAAEMHALEKAALQDPFLAEAIEGYESADLSTVETDLTAIYGRLQEQDITKIIPLSPFRSWWKIAAMVIVVAGAGTIGWKILSDQPGKKQETVSQIIPTAKEILPDQKQTNTTAAVSKTERNKKTVATKMAANEPVTARESSIHRGQGDIASLQSTTRAPETSDSLSYSLNNNSLADTRMLQGRVAGAPAQSAKEKRTGYEVLKNAKSLTSTISREDKGGDSLILASSGFITGANAKLNYKVAEPVKRQYAAPPEGSLQSITLSPMGRATTSAAISSLGFSPAGNVTAGLARPVMSDSFTLDEVVVTGYSPQRRVSVTGAVVQKPDDRAPAAKDYKALYPPIEQSQTTMAYPAGGWNIFIEELREKIRTFKENRPVVHGDIDIKMKFNKKGKAVRATILKTFDTTLNALVIEAVKQHGQWELPAGSKGQQQEMTVTLKL
jgi:predicted negative regulator of RcsB-dependent stress response